MVMVCDRCTAGMTVRPNLFTRPLDGTIMYIMYAIFLVSYIYYHTACICVHICYLRWSFEVWTRPPSRRR